MNTSLGVDVHAHYFPQSSPPRSVLNRMPQAPRLEVDSPAAGRIMKGKTKFRDVRAALWSLEERCSDMDAAGIGLQVISPVPVTLEYDAPAEAFAEYCRWLNESIAAEVRSSNGRLAGLGTVPLTSPEACVTEMVYLREELGLEGIEIGTRVAGMELDDPRLDFFFETTQRLGLALLIHPVDGGGGAIRRSDFVHDFGLGMTTDTALAATALVFGGVLDRYPDLRISLSHGCGTFPWAYPRLRLGARIAGTHNPEHLDQLVSKLYADSLVFDPNHLTLLAERFGTDKVLLGSDHPFIPSQPESGIRDLAQAASTMEPGAFAQIFRTNALTFLGRTQDPSLDDPAIPPTQAESTRSAFKKTAPTFLVKD